MSRGKKYKASVAEIDRQHLYTPVEAVDLVKQSAKASFDETVELAIRLGVDPRKADQIVRGTLSLPAGTGRTARVAVVAAGEKAAEARAAGADEVSAAVASLFGGFGVIMTSHRSTPLRSSPVAPLEFPSRVDITGISRQKCWLPWAGSAQLKYRSCDGKALCRWWATRL